MRGTEQKEGRDGHGYESVDVFCKCLQFFHFIHLFMHLSFPCIFIQMHLAKHVRVMCDIFRVFYTSTFKRMGWSSLS